VNGHARTFLVLLGVIAVAGIVAGTVLATTGYSSAGAFSVASACVGVLGTLAAQRSKPEP
jgi:uncharacterized membrane protein YjjB (DUF3815 family)